MLIKSHWNLNYVFSRIKYLLIKRKYPDKPWLVAGAVNFLEQWLLPSDNVLETGSGRSTLWFAKRTSYVLSIEHNEKWYEEIKRKIQDININNIDYFFESISYEYDPLTSGYLKRVSDLVDNYFDLVLIDGKLRGHCALIGLQKLKNNGIMVIDNVERYIFIGSKTPESIKDESQMTEEWIKFKELTSDYRKILFDNGITVTMMIFKN